ncbi:hypothetical protein LJC27_02480 [Christensenellaceae bacterium OttesenSCG-928-M15]|nr:hypothetical protein [Christensenellaceae bacterium OttesenSCG-928-M15]
MLQKNSGYDSGMLYGNALIRQVDTEENDTKLRLKLLYDDREYISYLYQDVYYSQIDKKTIGKRIALVTELEPGQLDAIRHRYSIGRLLMDHKQRDISFLYEHATHGYRILMHYFAGTGERIVIAKQLRKIPYG